VDDFVKKFKEWFVVKIELSNQKSPTFFKQGELWWCSVGMNLGEEIFGKGRKFTRPVLVFKKFTSDSFMGLPLTSKEKRGSWYVEIVHAEKKSWVILNQARILDRKRLTNRIGTLDDAELNRVKEDFLKFYNS